MFHRPLVYLVLLLTAPLRLLPLPALSRIGGFVGGCLYHLLPIRRKVVRQNIDLAYGDSIPPERKKEIAKGAYVHLMKTIFEWFGIHRLKEGEKMPGWIYETDHHLNAGTTEGKGILILTAHLGNFPMHAAAEGRRGIQKGTLLNKQIGSKLTHALWTRTQERMGVGIITATEKDAIRRMFRVLKSGESLGMVIDVHRSTGKGVVVPFFGRPARTMETVAVMSERTGAPAVPGFMIREGPGRYRLHYEPPIAFESVGDRKENLRHNTARYSAVIEQVIRRWPEQWFWFHRRWKVKPTDPDWPGETP